MSSLLEKASLIQVPSGYKDGTLYSQIPINGGGDFTFSRGSNLAATRVNSEGLIEKGRENLLLQSNTFDTTWASTNLNITSGQTGYDGSNDAWLLSISGGTSDQRIFQNIQYNGVSTLSVYAKKNDSNWLSLRIGSSVNKWYDLENGVLGGSTIVTAYIDASIEDVGNGWYRCSLTFTDNFTTSTRIYPAENDLDITHTSGSIYIQDAQTEVGLVATNYIETTTTTAQAGILEDMPRLDYSGGATCPSLLLEPQRTNLITQSEYFEEWSGAGAIATNTTISPEGVQNASTLTTSSAGEDLRDNTNVTGTYVFSVFVKLIDVGGVRLRIDAATDANAYFDLSDGSVYDSDGIIEADAINYGNNWWRVYMVANVTNTQKFQVFTTDGTTSYENGSVYLYGAMLETGSYPTSYIPTYGASVTRGADSCSKTGISSLIGQTEGTMFVEYNSNITEDDSFFLVVDDGTANNRIVLYSNTPNNLALVISTGGVLQTIIPNIPLASGTNKFAVAYANNDIALYLNGVSKGTDNTATIPATSALRMGTDNTGAGLASGKGTKQAVLFKTRLSNTELANLTTL